MNMSEIEKEQFFVDQDRMDISETTSANESESDEVSDGDEDDLATNYSQLYLNNSSDIPLESAEKKEDEKKSKKTIKWKFLEHKGPIFPPDYKRLPDNVKLIYDKKEITLSSAAEEVAGFYAKMLDHPYTQKRIFNENFFTDWCNVMTSEEKAIIKDFTKCDFTQIKAYFIEMSENAKKLSDEEKKTIKTNEEKIQNEYGYCNIDGRREKICKNIIEPPGLFRGLGNNQNMGKLKVRVTPEEVTINCSPDSVVPKPPEGHEWGEVKHVNTVSWLASWVGKVSGKIKYVELHRNSKLRGEKDKKKYDTAKHLHKYIDEIRKNYTENSKYGESVQKRQLAVALYFIDKLALRAGNENDQTETFGCCSLRVKHVDLHDSKENDEHVVELHFPGKASISYHVQVSVEPHIFNNLKMFKEDKKDSDVLFDTLNTKYLNDQLKELMPKLTAKVFRTYNASMMLQQKLDAFDKVNATLDEKIKYYRQANIEVAILCNHKRTKKTRLSSDMPENREDQAQKEDKENNEFALSTSKNYYLDPRITVAWCLKHDVPIHEVYSKDLQKIFKWAITLKDKDYVFG